MTHMQVNSELHWDSTPLTTSHVPASATPISEEEAQREEEMKKTEVVNDFFIFVFFHVFHFSYPLFMYCTNHRMMYCRSQSRSLLHLF